MGVGIGKTVTQRGGEGARTDSPAEDSKGGEEGIQGERELEISRGVATVADG